MVIKTQSKNYLSSKLEGFTISLIHYLIVIMSFILGIFTKDWLTLGVITFNLLTILTLNMYLQNCPLTKMENDKLGTGITNLFMNFFYKDKNNPNTTYVIQTGAIIFMLSLLCVKGMVLLFKRNIKEILYYLE
tara:strand:- start:49 stop:447 length:399 start_codon:yes stop_codon:yes gene_type:complete